MSRLEMIVQHDGRLNLLCCLVDGGPLTVPQIAARIGESSPTVRYWANLLDSYDLIEEHDRLADGEPLYAAALDDQPEWVWGAVREHRPRAL
jgi:hypothetical protein